jgi:cation transport protein ChaC
MSDDLFLFGYGSLMFKTNFEYVSWEPAYVRGFQRVFYQGSCDHRGVPGSPGRVATMLRQEDGIVTGVLFRIAAAHKEDAIAALDLRERAGYAQYSVPSFRFVSGGQFDDAVKLTDSAVCYIATEDNEEFLGPRTEKELAAEIVVRRGPSGSNAEYLIKVAEALRLLGAEDPHIFAIERHVKSALGVDSSLALLKEIPL